MRGEEADCGGEVKTERSVVPPGREWGLTPNFQAMEVECDRSTIVEKCKTTREFVVMNAPARLAVGTSFVLFSVVGASFVIAYWADRSIGWATGRAALYIVVIGCVHVIRYVV
jgi:hypothetical protein